ncbi:TetR family transcriptional regulator [Kitasatospora sp. NBC_01287]|uniref:TetR family transcriptional regulator n=1 Tax=Kitasatospora sp. NBC_01287 TaxID=2903573 RepID=UPI0022584D4D|nr:TetR family transcriptional regulator [Kitasatospora sp. NBC_01287]MCX4745770.1 TetR family transcriptional regulator [Kitasatospora sp. NBC_01287]
MSDEVSGPDLRARRRRRARLEIQRAALRLFAERGYEEVTVPQIAAAAEISASTFFRHFPSKEDVVLHSEDDVLVVRGIAAQPAELPAVEAIRRGYREACLLVEDSALLYQRSLLIRRVPALRAKTWERYRRIIDALTPVVAQRLGAAAGELGVCALTAGCVAAAGAATDRWVDTGGAERLADLVDEAFGFVQSSWRS